MANQWVKVNPDGAVDPLPMPYSLVNEVVEDIVEAVGEEIQEIESKKRSSDYENALPKAYPYSYVQVPGRITCAYVEPRGTARLAIGTSDGEAILVDTRLRQEVAQAHAFPEGEAVTCICICSEAAYQEVPVGPGIEPPPAASPAVKLFVTGQSTPKIFAYDIERQHYGLGLKPSCAIHVSKPEVSEELAERPIIEQLHTRGVVGGIWVVALLCDRSVRAYLCPLGQPPARDDEGTAVLDKPIVEGDEEEEEEAEGGAGGPGEEFADAMQLHTPVYTWSLAQLAPMPSLPMPELDTITLSVFLPRPVGGAYGRGFSSGQVPTLCFSSSLESNAMLAHSLPAPAPVVAPAGLEINALLMEAAPVQGKLQEPAATTKLQPRRRWTLPAKTSAVAVSPNGGIYAVGGSQGSIALMNTASGPSLRTMLPGHYGAVSALVFHRADILLSVGSDCWVHYYDMKTDTLLSRHLSSPPPTPSPALGIAASQSMGLGVSLDTDGSLRLLNMKLGCKIAKLSCVDDRPKTAENEEEETVITPNPDETPKLLLSTASGFCILAMADLDQTSASLMHPAEDEDRDELHAEEGEGAPQISRQAGSQEQGRSWLVFFEQGSMLKQLFPTLAEKAGEKGSIGKLFSALTQEELAKLQPQAVPSTMEKAMKLAEKMPPPNPAAVRAAQLEAAAKAAETPTRRGRRNMPDTPNTLIAKLTSENLRKFAQAQQAEKVAQGLAKAGSSFGSGAFKSATQTVDDKKEEVITPHGVPKNWQVSVKTQLKKGLAAKENRQMRIAKRMDQLAKEVGG
mmetsp:Transcript_89884/g.159928  ORF Transcript_89884/g.159928 Transcript_89884/m.159928 type:complete len:794 (+) Transcript_89884:65-2446(+)